MNAAEDLLKACLAGGARNSRDVIATMAEGGFSSKQTRRARELLAVVARKAGCGPTMRSNWELRSAVLTPTDMAASTPSRAHGDAAAKRTRSATPRPLRP